MSFETEQDQACPNHIYSQHSTLSYIRNVTVIIIIIPRPRTACERDSVVVVLVNPSTCIRERVIVVDAFVCVCVCVCVCVLANKVTLSKLFSNAGRVTVSKFCWQLL